MNEQDLQAIAEHIYRYAPCKPRLAMDRLMNIELIRNTYTKGTLFNMLQGTRRILKDGKIKSGMPKWLADRILTLAAKEPAQQAEPTMDEKPVRMTPQEQLIKLDTDMKKTEEYISSKIAETNTQIYKLQKIENYWQDQRRALEEEYKTLKSEILKQGTYDLLRFINEK